MLELLWLLSLGLGIAWLVVVALTIRTLTHPPRRGYGSALARGLPGDPSELAQPASFDSWTLQFGRCRAWDIAGNDPVGCVIIASHGWGRSVQDALARFDAVRNACSRFIAWDMPGHGDSPGSVALGATEWRGISELLEHLEAENRPIVLWGWSMGAGISIIAAAVSGPRVSGVIAESPYALPITPARNVLRWSGLPHRATLWPALTLIGLRQGNPFWHGFDRVELARRVAAPLLVLHGSEDVISPPEDGRRIAAAAPHGHFAEIRGGTHNGLWRDSESAEPCREAVLSFLSRIRTADRQA